MSNTEDSCAADLGWAVARFTKDRFNSMLILMHPSSDDDGVHSPAQSFRLYGDPAIKKLQALLNEQFPNEALTAAQLRINELERAQFVGKT